MGHRRLIIRNRRLVVGVLAAAAVGTVLAAPLAPSSKDADAVTINGARSLADKVSVQFQKSKERTTDVHLLAWNDFHGNLEANAGLNIYGQFAGGAAWLAQAVEDKQAQYGDKQISVIAGDNIGASPLIDGLFLGEPSTIVTNLMHADFASVGNHEFDKGKDQLLRIQNGGCGPDNCAAAPYALVSGGTTNTYPGADFQYLSANVVRDDTGKTLFPAFGTRRIKSDSGKKFQIGIIGEVLESTPTIVTPTGVAGLTFRDEADAANEVVAQLRRNGVNTNILVIHQGGFQAGTATLNGCAGNLAGSDIAEIASRLDPSIKVIVSAHTHAEYRCTITTNGVTRLVTSASSFGRILSDITLTIDDKSGELVAAAATNSIVRNSSNPRNSAADVPLLDLPKDQRVADVVQQYHDASAPLANQVIGKVSQDILNAPNALGEIPSGDVIADAQLVATQPANLGGAQIAFMNPGGIRGGATNGFLFTPSGTEAPGEVTYGEAFTIQPFGNSLVTKTMTGAQIHLLLEQQFVGCGGQTTQRILQISAGFTWVRNASAAACADKVSGLTLNGQPVDPATTYRVTMNNFLAGGGDGFTVFNQGTNSLGGAQDIDALVAYFTSFLPNAVPNPPVNRITGS
jgi:5'-nucleotidase